MRDETLTTQAQAPGNEGMRRVPNQRRARERVERILAVATQKIAARGLDAVRMSDIAEAAEISIGSLYQYFPDKAAIVRSVAEGYNAEGHACVARELGPVETFEQLSPALHRVVDGFYQMYLDYPAMTAIWQATQADASLQAVEAEDATEHGRRFAAVIMRLRPELDPERSALVAGLAMTLLAAAVRHAVTLEPAAARQTLDLFKQMLPADLGL